ncbi:MAG: mechanosensitive ion channel family protein [Rhizobiaceae bacterium]|nr:mechanosensitive ion channel family protein [Rhizobiaceae bacterium]
MWATPAAAQAPQAGRAGVDAKIEQQIADFGVRIDSLAQQMRVAVEDDNRLVDIRNQLETIGRELLAASVALGPRLSEINTRLEQIGPPPAEGQPQEPPGLAEERTSLQQEKAAINALLGTAENLSVRISRLVEEIAELRRELFASQLTRRYDILTALSPAVVSEAIAELRDLYNRFHSWIQFSLRFKLNSVLFATFFALTAAALLLIGGRRIFGRLIHRDPTTEDPPYITRLSVAFWSTFLSSAALCVFLIATYFLLAYFNVMRPDVEEILATVFNVIATVYFVNRLARATFSPRLPNWRLVAMETPAARTLFWLVWATAIVTGFDFVLNRVNLVLASPLSLTIAKSLLATVLVGLLVVAIATVKPYVDDEGRPKPWPALVRFVFYTLGFSTILAAVLGYIGLARFISQQIVVTGAILATMYLGHLSSRAISDLGSLRHTRFGRWLDDRFSFDESTEDQIGLALSVVLHLVILLIGVPLILLQWGFQWGDITTWALRVVYEIRIGSVSFSLMGLATGILVFILGYFATRWFQGWLDGSVMTRGKVDAGVRNSIRTVIGYAGIAVAALIGISAAGIDLSNLALVAGGLSLGIGFGLQNIVQNFVSGLILLVERPFKAGDWIVAGGVSGNVRRISVRATEIETFQKQTVILPNSTLINDKVANWTHRNKLGRTEVPIGAAYDADPRKVHALLTEIIDEQPAVLRNPAPHVQLVGFADSSINFEMRFFLADITAQLAVTNEIKFRIYERFKEEGIGIPFPQRGVNLPQDMVDAVKQMASAQAAEPSKPRAGRTRRPKS